MPRGAEIGRGYIAVEVDEDGAKAALRGFVGFAGSAFKAAAATTGLLVAAGAKVGIAFDSMKETAQVAFTTLLGSGEKAQSFLMGLQKFSAATPFELPGLIDNARQLLGVGVAADKVIPTLTALGDTAGALGIDQDHFNNILLATTQAMGKGKLQGEELMQMVENGIPVWQELSKATGKSVPELQKLSSAGKLLSADTLPKLFAQMEKDYGGSMAKQSATLSGKWSSLTDNTKILMGTAFKPLFDLTKDVVGGLGDLAASDAGRDFAQKFADHLKVVLDAGRNFVDLLRDKFGDQAGDVFDQIKKKASDTFGQMKQAAPEAISALAGIAEQVVPGLLQLATVSGGVLHAGLQAAVSLMHDLSAAAPGIGQGIATAAQTVSAIAVPAFAALNGVLQVLVGIGGAVLRFAGDAGPAIGVIGGIVLATTVGWRGLSTVVDKVGSAINNVKPDTVAGKLKGFAKSGEEAANKGGELIEKWSGSADAGTKFASAGGKVVGALTKVGSYLPLAGVGIAALGGLYELATSHVRGLEEEAQNLGQALAVGGTAGRDAGQKLAGFEQDIRNAQKAIADLEKSKINPAGYNPYGGNNTATDANIQKFQADMADAKTKLDGATKAEADYIAQLGPVGLAQARASQAQQDYNAAVQQYGESSPQAIAASLALQSKTDDLADAQQHSADATRNHTLALRDLAQQALTSANADLQYRQAITGVSAAQDSYNKVLKDGKATAVQRQQAEQQLEAAQIQAVNAAVAKAQAENSNKTATEQAAAANRAQLQTITDLVVASNGHFSPALQTMVDRLDSTELQSWNTAAALSGVKTKVVELPNGKKILIGADDQATAKIRAAQIQLEKFGTIRVTAHLQVDAAAVYSTLDNLGHRVGVKFHALGGTAPAGQAYVAGEGGGHAELIFPDRASYVATASQSRPILAASPGGGASAGVQQTNYFSAPMDEEAYATIATRKLAWASRFGG